MPDLEQRVLVLAPTGRDGVLACQLLSSMDVPGHACTSAAELFQEIAAGAGAVILADEALQPGTVAGLLATLAKQPPWSDLPLIVFTRSGESSEHILETLERTGGHRAKAADLLGIGLRTLQRKLKEYKDEGYIQED